ncbi:hypothetical protein BX667DRAFT_513774 [Coemansia mojavensis]|nr:hypothetical protein BX667DRAFT_513774 [Coemansia mojavensis]
MSSSLWVMFRIPGHKLRIIEVDGVSTASWKADGLDLGPGQHISALVAAFDSAGFNSLYNVTIDFIDMQQENQESFLPVDRQIDWAAREHITKHDMPLYSFGDFAFNYTLVPSLFAALSVGQLALHSSVYCPQSLTHVLRDSATIRAPSYLKIRFRVDRGFVALVHCHIKTHVDHGMGVILVAAPDLLQKHVKAEYFYCWECRWRPRV